MVEPILVLASNSPRRRQLLALAGWPYQSLPVEIDESPLPGERAEAYVLRLAESKALAAARRAPIGRAPAGRAVLAADTTVADDQGILAKPADEADAFAMLRRLRGRAHQVYTALAVIGPQGGAPLTGLCETRVFMREYSEAELAEYVASRDPLDKAGAYAIQHAGFHPVEKLEGCYANVVGLPLCRMQQLLKQVGLAERLPLPACDPQRPSRVDYETCPICRGLARGEYAL